MGCTVGQNDGRGRPSDRVGQNDGRGRPSDRVGQDDGRGRPSDNKAGTKKSPLGFTAKTQGARTLLDRDALRQLGGANIFFAGAFSTVGFAGASFLAAGAFSLLQPTVPSVPMQTLSAKQRTKIFFNIITPLAVGGRVAMNPTEWKVV